MENIVILFILYSIFQYFFGDKKKKEQLKKRQQRQRQSQQTGKTADSSAATSSASSKKQPESWQDVMKELESVFTGEPAETEDERRARRETEFRRPEPSSIQSKPQAEKAGDRDRRYEQSSRYDHFEEDSFWEKEAKASEPANRESALARAKRGEKINMGNEPGLEELAEDADNPIFGGSSPDVEDPRKGGVSKAAAASLLHRIKDPSSASQAIIMKEILDKPMARRRSARHSF
jgi:hypothetical protein